ncbi:MAG: Uma2 family endonuclease [Chloroflexia bacterium]|nr:Uma2 family endonuclease [Chloroflexia bacterium]
MAVAQRMSEQAYQEFVLSGVEGRWELHDGQLVEKLGMSWEHDDLAERLGYLLRHQLDRAEFRVRVNGGRVRKSDNTVFMPNVMVVPTAYGQEFRGRPGILAIFAGPLPLVVEVWSRSTGNDDIDSKLPIYQQRGDLEIWRIHPYERTLTSWQRQPDGSYRETLHRDGMIEPIALPGVTIDLAELFAV